MEYYKVRIVGYIYWPGGLECSNEYTFHAEDDQAAIDRLDYTPQRIAGDFSNVEDYELFRREYCPTCGHTVWECVKEFTAKGADIYLECVS